MTVPSIQPAFSKGEIAPALFGRVDVAPYHSAAATMRNMFVSYRGGAYSRAGTAFVALSQQPVGAKPRLIPFQFSITQGYVLEFGEQYMRVIFNGAYVLNNSSQIFQIATIYHAADLPLLKYVQSADVMSLTHPLYPPQELKRIASNNWTISAYTIAAPLPAPGTVTAVANNTSPPTGQQAATFAYVVTAIDINGHESFASPIATCTGVDIALTAGSNTISWSAVGGATSYNVYKAPIAYGTGVSVPVGSQFGYAATAFGTQWVDSNVVADFTQTPPLFRNPLQPGQIIGVTITANGSGYTSNPTLTINTTTGANAVLTPVIVNGALTAVIVSGGGGGYAPTDTLTISGGGGSGAAATLTIGPQTGTYPSVVAYFQQRRVYANTINQPDTMFFSQPGNFSNFDVHDPVIDSDAITATPWAEQVNGISWLIQMPGGLVTLTGKAAWQVTGQGGSSLNPQPITPSSVQAQPQGYNGCNNQVPPIKINYDILFVQALGSTVRDLEYQYWQNIYTGTDITVWNSHLFYGHQILEWAWCEEPNKIVWAVREDGVLLSLTYLKEQQFIGWARHDTQGQVVSVCSVTEPPVNALYMVVLRTINGQAGYYIERMDNRIWLSTSDPWCVDCGLSYSGPLTNQITAAHLPNMPVVGLADGVPVSLTLDSNGHGILPFNISASNIKIGLPFTAQLQTVYLDDGAPTLQGRRKNIFAVTVRVEESYGFQVGANQPDGSVQSPPVTATTWTNMADPTPQPQEPPLVPFVTSGGGAGTLLYTGDLRAPVVSAWKKHGQVAVQQTQPLPLNVVALMPEYLPGDMPEAVIEARQQRAA